MTTISTEIFDNVLSQIEAEDPRILDDAERIISALERVANDARKLSGEALAQGERSIRAVVFSRDDRPLRAFYRLSVGVPCLAAVWKAVWTAFTRLMQNAVTVAVTDITVELRREIDDLLAAQDFKALKDGTLSLPDFKIRVDGEKSPYVFSFRRIHEVTEVCGKGRLLSVLTNLKFPKGDPSNPVLNALQRLQDYAADWHKVDVSVRSVDKITQTQRTNARNFAAAAQALGMTSQALYKALRKGAFPLVG